MRTLFSSLLCFSLLFHAMLGCCWRVTHDASGCEVSRVSSAACPTCGHNRDAAANKHGSQQPCEGHSHCRGLCTYLLEQKSQNSTYQSDLLVDIAVDTGAICGSDAAALSFSSGTPEFCPRPPLRLHLFYQVVLI